MLAFLLPLLRLSRGKLFFVHIGAFKIVPGSKPQCCDVTGCSEALISFLIKVQLSDFSKF